MKKVRFILSLVTVLTVLLFAFGMNALARTVDQDELEVTMTSDKPDYTGKERITEILSVRNDRASSVGDLTLRAEIPEGYRLAADSVSEKNHGTLKPGETVTMYITFESVDSPAGGSGVIATEGNTAPAAVIGTEAEATAAPIVPTVPGTKKTSILPIILIIAGILLLLLLGGLIAYLIMRKKRKKKFPDYTDFTGGGGGITLALICASLIAISASSFGVTTAKAAETSVKTIPVLINVTVDGELLTLNAEVSYDLEPSDTSGGSGAVVGGVDKTEIDNTEIAATQGETKAYTPVPGSVPVNNHKSNIFPIIIIAGVILLLLLIGLLIFLLIRKKRKKKNIYTDYTGGSGSGGVML